jgi:fyn-related kinase
VISISQYNEKHNTFDWHYLICINSSNNCFYFSQEVRLKNIFFSSFQQLIADDRVRAVIPLTEILPYSIEFEEDVWKIPFDALNIQHQIGKGQFGEVSYASWQKGHTTISVAVKKLHIRGVTSIVQREIEAMKKLRNIYIVTLYGISQNPATDEILIVTELMEDGDLKSWLKQLPNLPEYFTLLRFAKDISCGMTYLEFRNYVHRDLACRNILLGPHESFVKISDFGLSTIANKNDTDQRQQAHSEKLPVRWLAPELLDNQAAYSIKSDVWSFGILLIELWLKGGDPYGEEHLTWIQSAVSNGFVHKKPKDCPDDFYESVICQCLKFESKARPSFSALRQLFEKWPKDTIKH